MEIERDGRAKKGGRIGKRKGEAGGFLEGAGYEEKQNV